MAVSAIPFLEPVTMWVLASKYSEGTLIGILQACEMLFKSVRLHKLKQLLVTAPK